MRVMRLVIYSCCFAGIVVFPVTHHTLAR